MSQGKKPSKDYRASADGLLARFLSTVAPATDANAGRSRLLRRRPHELLPGEVLRGTAGKLERWQVTGSTWEGREIASELFPLLGEGAGFLDPGELQEFLDHIVRVEEDELDPAIGIDDYVRKVRDAIYRDLDADLGAFRFEFGLSVDGYLVPAEAWGEAPLLRVSGNAVPGQMPLVLFGEVSARTANGAQRKAEEMVQAFVGASYALGLIGYLPALDGCGLSWSYGLSAVEPSGGHSKVAITPCNDSAKNGPPQDTEDASPGFRATIHQAVGTYPKDLSELELAQLKSKQVGAALTRRIRALKGVMTGSSEAAGGMRSLCGLACAAASATDPGISLSLAFSVVEGLLLDPSQDSDVQARLREAVAFLLGSSSEERARLRLSVRELYRLRSRFMHRGGSRPSATSRDQSLELMRAVLRRELEVMAENAVS